VTSPAPIPEDIRGPDGTRTLCNAAGLAIQMRANGALGRIDCHGVMVNLFPGHEVEGGPANLWLRRHGAAGVQAVPLLGPASPLRPQPGPGPYTASGSWRGLELQLQLRLAADAPAWFWHLLLRNDNAAEVTLDLLLLQDIGLAPYGSTRLNEHYVSHYIDLSPLEHAGRCRVLAARQNLAVQGRHPWALMGSLRCATAYATDALQTQGLAVREGALPQGVRLGLPGQRLQHEHALIALQDEALTLAPGATTAMGFFAQVLADHAEATAPADIAWVDATLALAEAQPLPWAAPAALTSTPATAPRSASLFVSAPWLATLDLDADTLYQIFGPLRRHEEIEDGRLLSFFHGAHSHVVLREKELRTQRPHGHMLRSGLHLVPDEASLTSSAWMGGVFHSMVTQGHVSINRFLSTVRGWLGQYRSQGQRIFVRGVQDWQQLGLPSAFEIEADSCRWLYRHAGGLLEVRSQALHAPHALALQLRVLTGDPVQLRLVHHLALGGDDGLQGGLPTLRAEAEGVYISAPAGSELAARFPGGGFAILPEAGSRFDSVGGDEMLYADGCSRGLPFVCIDSGPVSRFGLRIEGRLLQAAPVAAGDAPLPQWVAPPHSALAPAVRRLADIAPWWQHNAFVHYLAPRGLEQFSGGGWGTRDVCQGPLEMLLALDRPEPVRELLCRVFAAQNADGDWPQWFMFFDRERDLRAGDSHGDIVFWPLLALARYLVATEDAALLEQALPFYTPSGAAPDVATVWQHVERALAVIAARRIAGTHLAAYGHGDWNDSLQPADPALRERLCSAWTVTLHHQMLHALADALCRVARPAAAAALQAEAAHLLADFQRLLVVEGVVTGYALFPEQGAPQLLLHPSDSRTGVHYSLLPMMHAILDNMLSPDQAALHLALIETHLKGPDGARLFDRPLRYHGGRQELFQRAESSAFFGREIGVMYMHAHLRYTQTLAHMGQADAFLHALAQAHPVALRERVPSASLRQANCYFSSSDAAFADRYQAQDEYERVAAGTVALDGGWRIYSSGPGIAIGLVVGSLLGLRREKRTLVLDPVLPQALDGLRARCSLAGRQLELVYRPGAQGCGPTALTLNGSELPFQRGTNPYRSGAAEVAMADLLPLLSEGDNLLEVRTG